MEFIEGYTSLEQGMDESLVHTTLELTQPYTVLRVERILAVCPHIVFVPYQSSPYSQPSYKIDRVGTSSCC